MYLAKTIAINVYRLFYSCHNQLSEEYAVLFELNIENICMSEMNFGGTFCPLRSKFASWLWCLNQDIGQNLKVLISRSVYCRVCP